MKGYLLRYGDQWPGKRTRSGRTRSGRTRPGRPPLSLNDRISRYLAACPESIEGQRGDATTYNIACRLVWGFGLSESDALRYLRIYNETKCRPKWSERDLRSKVRQAFKRRKHLPRGEFL